MKAAFIHQPGPPDSIIIGDLPDPAPPSAGQVRVRVRAVAVNPIDTYLRGGMVPAKLPSPFIVGLDFAGAVDALGPDVDAWKSGDRVWGSMPLGSGLGASAELILIEADRLQPTPDNVDDTTAAALGVTGVTAHMGLHHKAHLQPGETVFVHGGTGGVGSMVVQIAKAAGARVITTAGSPDKAELARNLGADLVIEYKQQDTADVLAAEAPNGIDVWYETLREPDLKTTIPLLARGGRLILMAGREAAPPLPVGPLYTGNKTIYGLMPTACPPAAQRDARQAVNQLVAQGQLIPNIDRIMNFDQIAEAHQLQEDNTLRHAGTLAGKIILTLD